MPTCRNKDGELWDPETGIVYNDDGSVLRPGLVRTEPLAKAAAVKAEVGSYDDFKAAQLAAAQEA